MSTLKFELTIDETNVVMTALGRMPYESVFNLVQKLQQQAGPQLQTLQQQRAADQNAPLADKVIN